MPDLSGHSFRVGAALDMISQGESLARIMFKGGWKSESAALKYLRNYTFDTSVTWTQIHQTLVSRLVGEL